MSTRETQEPLLPEPNSAPEAAHTLNRRLKDRIADLSLGSKAKSVGSSLAERMKSVQAAAPAASDLRDRMKSAADAVQGKLNRDALKAGRDGLAAKVEALLKPRPIEDAKTDAPKAEVAPAAPPPDASKATTSSAAGEAKARVQTDIHALKSRLDEALRERTGRPAAPDQSVVSAPAPGIATAAPDVTPPRIDEASTVQAASAKAPLIKGMFTRRATIAPVAAPAVAPVGHPPTDVLPIEPDPTTTQTSRTQRVRAAAEAERRRPILSLPLIAMAVAAGGILHVLTTFAIPSINTGSAFDRMRWQLQPNTARILPSDWLTDPKKQPQALPFLSADMRYAMCRYDLTQNSVQVAAVLPDIGWSLTLYTPQGDNFYAVPGQDGKLVTAEFTLNTASDRLLLPVPGVRRADTDAAQVTSPQREGLIIVRAPNRGTAYEAILDDALKRLSCRPTPRR